MFLFWANVFPLLFTLCDYFSIFLKLKNKIRMKNVCVWVFAVNAFITLIESIYVVIFSIHKHAWVVKEKNMKKWQINDFCFCFLTCSVYFQIFIFLRFYNSIILFEEYLLHCYSIWKTSRGKIETSNGFVYIVLHMYSVLHSVQCPAPCTV